MKRLRDVTVKVGSGATPRGGKSVYVPEGVAFIRSQNVLDFETTGEGMAYITEEAAEALKGVSVRENDVLVNITGDSVARVAMWRSDTEARVSQHVAIVRCDTSKVVPSYVQYWLLVQQQKGALLTLASAGASRPALTKKMLEEFPIEVPELSIQDGITEVLRALDGKVAANRRIVRSVDDLIRAQVTSRLVKPSRLWSALDFVFGEAFKGDSFSVPGVGRALVRIRDLKSQKCQVWTTEKRPREFEVHPGALLVGMDAEFRATRWSGSSGVLNQRVLAASSDMYGPAIAREMLVAPLHRIERSKSGTTVIHLNKSDLLTESVLVPDDSEVPALRALVDPMWERAVAAEQESVRLAATRDELLPLLMSGKITVKDAEKTVEEVV